jgi:hypothetical protein
MILTRCGRLIGNVRRKRRLAAPRDGALKAIAPVQPASLASPADYPTTTIFDGERIEGVEMYAPSAAVECYVVRAPLFGSPMAVKRGLYHVGILFCSGDKKWVVSLECQDFRKLVPRISDNALVMDNLVRIVYYDPAGATAWLPYWTLTSELLCTITSGVYQDALTWILDEFAPNNAYYVLLGITSKPVCYGPNQEVQKVKVYTESNNCFDLVLRYFQRLSDAHTTVRPVPYMRGVLQIQGAPVEVGSKDPGFVKYVRDLQRKYAFMSSSSYAVSKSAQLAVIYEMQSSTYARSVDIESSVQKFWRIPQDDVTVSVEDTFADFAALD